MMAKCNIAIIAQRMLIICALAIVEWGSGTAINATQLTIDPDSVFTLTSQQIEQERIEANHLIAGKWQYDKPSVQAHGTSFVGKLGKPIAQSKLKKKLDKAYKKLKINQRWQSLELTDDGKWTINIKGKEISGTYSYSPSRGSITLKWHLISITAQVEREGKKLHLYFDTDRLLTLMRLLSGLSDNDTLKALAFLSENYSDVKVGFQLKKI